MTNIGDQLRALSAEIAPDRTAEQIMLESADEVERLTTQWDTACAAAEDHHEYVLAQINAGLKEEIERLKALLKEAADELAQHAHDEYPYRDKYPNEMRRYERDMELANRIRNQKP